MTCQPSDVWNIWEAVVRSYWTQKQDYRFSQYLTLKRRQLTGCLQLYFRLLCAHKDDQFRRGCKYHIYSLFPTSFIDLFGKEGLLWADLRNQTLQQTEFLSVVVVGISESLKDGELWNLYFLVTYNLNLLHSKLQAIRIKSSCRCEVPHIFFKKEMWMWMTVCRSTKSRICWSLQMRLSCCGFLVRRFLSCQALLSTSCLCLLSVSFQ